MAVQNLLLLAEALGWAPCGSAYSAAWLPDDAGVPSTVTPVGGALGTGPMARRQRFAHPISAVYGGRAPPWALEAAPRTRRSSGRLPM